MAKKGYLLLGAGVVVGAMAMAAVVNTPAIRAAHAQTPIFQAQPAAELRTEDLNTLRSLDESFARLAEFIEPATVLIKSEGNAERQTDVFGRRMPDIAGSGSGVIFRSDGWIMTNDHVVDGFKKVTVVLKDGHEFPGRVVNAPDSDIALVKIDASDLPTVQFANSAKVRPGQFAIAVGAPFGLENTLTVGHVSAVGRSTNIGDSRLGIGRRYADMIQTDASINMGNSGGPLLNIEGQVIGINTAIFSGMGNGGGSVGIGFAIPSNQAKLIADMLIEKGKISRGYLGFVPETIKEYQAKELGIEGGAVVSLLADQAGPAQVAGLQKDDVITKVGDYSVRNEQDLRNTMLHYSPGQTVKVDYVRGKEHRTAEIKVGTPPANPVVQRPTNKDEGGDEGDGGQMPRMFRDFRMPDMKDFGPFGNPPSKDEKEDVAPLREGKARLGVGVETVTPELRKQFHIPGGTEGAVVMSVEPGSVAEKIGLKPGDVILQFNGKAVKTRNDLGNAIESVKWGESRQLKYGRYGDNSTFVNDRTVQFR